MAVVEPSMAVVEQSRPTPRLPVASSHDERLANWRQSWSRMGDGFGRKADPQTKIEIVHT
jgi:hypothetical protein